MSGQIPICIESGEGKPTFEEDHFSTRSFQFCPPTHQDEDHLSTTWAT